MELYIIKNKESKPFFKCGVQKDGKILFNPTTSKELGISKGMNVKFATNEKKELLLIVGTPHDAESYELHSWGKMGWYVTTSELLKSLDFDYKRNKIAFDIFPTNEVYEGCKVYLLTPRTQPRNIKK